MWVLSFQTRKPIKVAYYFKSPGKRNEGRLLHNGTRPTLPHEHPEVNAGLNLRSSVWIPRDYIFQF